MINLKLKDLMFEILITSRVIQKFNKHYYKAQTQQSAFLSQTALTANLLHLGIDLRM